MTLNSGLTWSIQAGQFIYSSPKNSIGPHTHVEVGFPSEEIQLLNPFAENPDDLTGTVYPYVPIEIIEQIISDNGGIEEAEHKPTYKNIPHNNRVGVYLEGIKVGEIAMSSSEGFIYRPKGSQKRNWGEPFETLEQCKISLEL